MKKIKYYLSIILVLTIMLCNVAIFVSNAASEDVHLTKIEDIIIQDNELQPMKANSCTGTYVPSSWTTDTSYQGTSMGYACYLHGWTLSGNNIISNGVIIGRYDLGHWMDGKWTVAHFHIFEDGDNIHYIF